MKYLSKRIKELREEKGLTQLGLGKALGFTQAAIAKWEKDTRTPSIDSIITMAKFFNCSIDYLVGLEDELIFKQN